MSPRAGRLRQQQAAKRRSARETQAAIEARQGSQNYVWNQIYDTVQPYLGDLHAHNLTRAADWVVPGVGAAITGEDALDIFKNADSFGDYALGGALGVLSAGEMVPIAGKLARPVSKGLKEVATSRGLLDFIADESGEVPLPRMLQGPEAPPMLRPEDHGRVSTRQPWGKGSTEDPLTDNLVADTEAMLRLESTPDNLKMMTEQYPGMRGLWSDDVAETAENIKDHMKGNYKSLYELAEESDIVEESRQWYQGAGRIAGEMADRFGTTREKASGVLAVMSPQKDWYQNVALGERVIKHHAELPPTARWTPEMDAHVNTKAKKADGTTAWTADPNFEADVRGRPWGEMETPRQKAQWLRAYDEAHYGSNYREISPTGDVLGVVTKKDGKPAMVVHQSWSDLEKAMRILDGDGSLEMIGNELGKEHKVRNFFNNIYNPDSPLDATIDTHHIAGGLMMPYGSSAPEVQQGLSGQTHPKAGMPWGGKGAPDVGTKGAYGLYFDATKDLAKEMDKLPREMQSITWEQLRTLFPPHIRGNHPFVAQARAIWSAKDAGEITADEARSMIIRTAQGLGHGGAPSWRSYDGVRGSIKKGAAGGAGAAGLIGGGLATAEELPMLEEEERHGPR